MKIKKFTKSLNSYLPLWNSLSPKRRKQLMGLQLLSVTSAFGEMINLGALLPFLKLLSNPQIELDNLGQLAIPLKALPEKYLLLTLGLAFISLVILSTFLRIVTLTVQMRVGALIAADLGEQVFSNVLARNYGWHIQQNSSIILGYLTKDVDQVFGSVQGALTIIANFSIVLLLGITLISLSPKVMGMAIIAIALFYVLVFKFSKNNLRKDAKNLTNNYEKSIKITQEGLGGIRDVILDKTQDFFANAYRQKNLEYRISFSDYYTKVQIPRYLIEGLAIIFVVIISEVLTISGETFSQQLPLLGTLVMGAFRILQPLQQCFNGFSSLHANQESLNKISPLLGYRNKQNSDQINNYEIQLPKKLSNSPLVELKNINFRYQGNDKLVLKNINLKILAGERIAFIGTTGSGKSTCSDLILGLLFPTEGKILINGNNLHTSKNLNEHWKKCVAHVPQQIYLSDASFSENIAFGVDKINIDIERVIFAAKRAKIHETIESTKEGYCTMVGERGVRLSGGQRQRIGIARALYKDAKLLVLDEATSALDNQTESEVMKAIEELDRDITILIIAHRLSTVRNCDRIIGLEKGSIITVGTYKELEVGHPGFQRLSDPQNQTDQRK